MNEVLLENGKVFDGVSEALSPSSVLIRGGEIATVLPGSHPDLHQYRKQKKTRCLDIRGKTVLPGLIDAHFHAHSYTLDMNYLAESHPSYSFLCAGKLLKETLFRGFTSIRDTGGADFGLVRALEDKVIMGPHLHISGRPLSQTGGHGDLRSPDRIAPCSCDRSNTLAVVVDGEDDVRKAAREELRRGASFLKIFVSGGVISPADPISMRQFTEREIRAAVEEAGSRGTYVAAHSHTAEATRRCAEYGVRTIEHGTMIDLATAEYIASQDVYVVPTLSILEEMLARQKELPEQMQEKSRQVCDAAYTALENCENAGVRLGFGTDLFGHLHGRENLEFEYRARVSSPINVLRSATSVNAKMMGLEGKVGVIQPGAQADLVVVRGNPLDNISLMSDPERNFPVIIKQGEIFKNTIETSDQSMQMSQCA